MGTNKSCLLGVDIGTSNIKVAAFETDGQLLTLKRSGTPVKLLTSGWAEHNIDDLWRSTSGLIKDVVLELQSNYCIEAIAIAGFGEAGTLCDNDGDALHPVIAWFDARALEQANWWEKKVGKDNIFHRTGMSIDPTLGGNKLLWMRAHYPEIYRKACWWLSLVDILNHRLSGVFVTDQSIASRTMLFDQKRRDWSLELIQLANLKPSLFPPALISGTQIGKLSSQASQVTELKAGTPVVLGGHDHLCGAFVARQGQDIAIDSTGTTEVLLLPASSYLANEENFSGVIYCYADVVPDRYVYSARVGYAGGLVDWFERVYLSALDSRDDKRSEYQTIFDQITTPLEHSGLMCFPAFGRLISPEWDRNATLGAILGLTINHRRGHILQALLEGNSYALRKNIEAIEMLSNSSIHILRVVGGVTKNPIWMQIKADITGREIEAVQLSETTVLGAAILAGVGVGCFRSHYEAASQIKFNTCNWQPSKIYQSKYDRLYKEIYCKLSTTFSEVNRLLLDIS
jgi:xylulokinase